MSTPFSLQEDLIIIPVRLCGPLGDTFARFALDTGATETVVRSGLLARVGYEPTQTSERMRVATASDFDLVPRLILDRFEALEQNRTMFPVLSLILPTASDIDGLLGLDFIRGQELRIDYRTGRITLL